MKTHPKSALTPAIKEAAAAWVARHDAGLTSSEEGDLQAWLEADPRHKAAFFLYGTAWSALDRPHLAGSGDDLLHRIELRVQQRKRRVIYATTTIALLLTVGAVWRFHAGAELPTRRSPPADAVVLLPKRQVLPDGSIVKVKDGTEIHVAFTNSARCVELRQGEAEFQVTKDPARPFIVQTGGIDIRAVGTAFSVQVGRSEVAVLVTEGRVALDRAAFSTSAVAKTDLPASSTPQRLNSTSRTFAFVSAGNRIVIPIQRSETRTSAAALVTPVSYSELDELLAWRASRVEFSGATLAEAVAIMNSYSAGPHRVSFVIADASIAQIRVSGLFRLDKTEAFMHLLKNGFELELDDAGDGRIIIRRAR